MSSVIAATALTQTVVLYSTLLPRAGELRAMTDTRTIAETRVLQSTAGVLSLACGIGLSLIDHDAAPFLVTVLSVAVLSAATEVMIRQMPTT